MTTEKLCRTQRAIRPLQVKDIDAGSREFLGYASVFGVVDSYSDVVMPGAFAESLEQHAKRDEMPALLWQHRASEPIGKWLEMREDENGLIAHGRLTEGVRQADEALALLRDGAIKGLSIGFALASEADYEYDSERGVFLLNKIQLWETSLVTFPANREATVTELRSSRAFENDLRDAGYSRALARKIAASVYQEEGLRDAGRIDETAARDSVAKMARILQQFGSK